MNSLLRAVAHAGEVPYAVHRSDRLGCRLVQKLKLIPHLEYLVQENWQSICQSLCRLMLVSVLAPKLVTSTFRLQRVRYVSMHMLYYIESHLIALFVYIPGKVNVMHVNIKSPAEARSITTIRALKLVWEGDYISLA
jgi:hypothetical protein